MECRRIVLEMVDKVTLETLNVQISNGSTAILLVCKWCRLEFGIVKRMLELGANPDCVGEYNDTALIVALEYKERDIAELLVDDMRVNINREDQWGYSVLEIALKYMPDIVQKIIDRGDVNFDIVNAHGQRLGDVMRKTTQEKLLKRGIQ